MGSADQEGSQQFSKANSKLKMAEREQGIKNLASNLLGGRSTEPAVTRLVSRSSATSESPSFSVSPTSAPLLLLYLCDSHEESAEPPKRWGNASSTWAVTVIRRRKNIEADLGCEGGRGVGRVAGRSR